MKVENLSFAYSNKNIFKDLNITFSDQKINAIIGPNGIGKSTLLDILGGLYPKAKTSLLDVPSHQQIAYKLQKTLFFSTVTVQQTLDMFQALGGMKPTAVMKAIYDDVLQPLLKVKIGRLSGGERQIVLTYGTCLLNRKLYMFDEPTNGIDPTNSELILKIISSLTTEQQKQVILTMHQMDQLEKLDANIVLLADQHCIFEGNKQELLQQAGTDNLATAFTKLTQTKVNTK